MKVLSSHWLVASLAGLLLAGAAIAGDERPESDEKCLERCDIESDQCMADSNGDPDKMQACDDKYSDCLQACPA